MPLPRRVVALAAGLALVALGVTGCFAGQRFSDLDREPTADDAIPVSTATWGVKDVDESSARFVGEYEGTRLWLMETEHGLCLLQYPNSLEWTSACTEPPGELGSMGPGGDFVVIPDQGHPPDGAVKISENVYSKN